ncbi:farnesyl pyrophosphate synthase 1-like [Helicoverpa zea]|uniref:farnesyl pyrophosphate synthase 1-like n=1 Tax=Helicoverpa zea TaxID=7113 RepID=UPI001F5A9680|nr:farnesyl pyrophosphate synthase 1-like [Helicoverpa zea]
MRDCCPLVTIMASLLRRSTLYCSQSRQLQKSAAASSVPNFNLNAERKAFKAVLPEVLDTVVGGPKLTGLPDVRRWIRQLLEYTLFGGKLGRGLMVSAGYRMFEEPYNYSEEMQHSARILGWCIEMLQTSYLVADDVIDGATVRRGKPCWHLRPNVGISAIKDFVLIQQCMMEMLDTVFGNTPIYLDLLRYFNESMYRTALGEHLDCSTAYSKEKNNIDMLHMDHVNAIAINKLAYYSFKLPIFVALLLVRNGKEKASQELINICMNLAGLVQYQDDYMDAYGNEIVTGKTGRDIQEGKCSWVAVTALQHCNDAQRSIFKQYYGSNDPEHVKRIKRLYDEVHLPQLYEACERTSHDDIVRQIQAIEHEGVRHFLLEVLNVTYKRVY